MALINVIIPVYNAQKYLYDAVNSVLDQPYKGIDIILVDDGSTDDSSTLCDQIAMHESCVAVIHQENRGVSAARNAGIEYVLAHNADNPEGYIAFLDADDLWIPNTITTNIKKMLLSDNKIDVYAFGGVGCDQSVNRFSVPKTYTKRQCNGDSQVIWQMECHFCANFYSIRLFLKWDIRFFNGLKYSEDKIFQMQCVFLSEKVQFMPQLLHIYRNSLDSAMDKARSISRITYYIPIIDGWIKSDEFINSWEGISHKHLRAGHILAGIYFMDMAADHYKTYGKHEDIMTVFQEHPYYYLFEQMKPEDVSAKQYKNHYLLLKHPQIFKLKYNIIGMAEYAFRLILKIPLINSLRMQKKYPLLVLPSDK